MAVRVADRPMGPCFGPAVVVGRRGRPPNPGAEIMVATLLLVAGFLPGSFDGGESPADPADLSAYNAARAGVGRGPEANVKLALWCEAHGLQPERIKHLALAVLTDPTNATARGLMGRVDYRGQWKRPDAVALKVKGDEALTARLAEYNARRAKAPDTADAQWSLALWCEQNELDAEARAHFSVVTRLDPSREAAWKRLGCKKVNGRWISESQLTAEKDDADAQKKADRHWKPLLTKWRGWLGDKNKRDKAEKALSEINDPRAVASVWSVFVAGKPSNHEMAVQVLGQIDAAASSRALAFLAVFDASAEVRRAATETLKRRDPREFAGLLVALLRDPIKYEVRPVGGPGSPGTLVIAGKKATLKRIYSPPATPNIPVMPGDFIMADANGLPVLERPYQKLHTGLLPAAAWLSGDPSDPFNMMVRSSLATKPMNSITKFDFTLVTGDAIPIGRVRLESLKTAAFAQQQLENDAAEIDRYNEDVREPNDLIRAVLSEVAGRDAGPDSVAWEAWWVDQVGFRMLAQKTSRDDPTVVENVPLNYQPPPLPIGTFTTPVGYNRMSCFGGGTLVRTLDGTLPIESIRVGDRVLTQDVKTAALGYQPVTTIYHNPPSPTFLVKVGRDTIVSSPFHRFWVVGKGWVMARDLKGSETLRLLDGPARVEAVESGPVQPVYNLDVADAHDFFAGSAAVLVHDNTLPDTRLVPFDAAPALAVAAPAH
jgi:hypothetical protein